MCVGIVFVGFVGYGALRLLYRDINKLQNQDPPEIAGTCNTINPGVFKTYKKLSTRENCMVFCLLQMLKYISWFIKRRVEARDRAVAPGGGAGVRGVERGEYNEGAVPTEGRTEGERPHQTTIQNEVTFRRHGHTSCEHLVTRDQPSHYSWFVFVCRRTEKKDFQQNVRELERKARFIHTVTLR